MIKRFPTVATQEVNRGIGKTLITIQRQATKNAPVDTGALRANWDVQTRGMTGKLRNRSKYAYFVHEGTKPHTVPIEQLRGWAGRHGVSPFLVQRAIARKGTKAQPFLSDAVKSSKLSIDNIWDKTLENIIKKTVLK